MRRKILAITFMLVMTLLITLKHPVLGYCLCLDAYFTGDCTCQVVQQTATVQDAVTPCCVSCADKTQHAPISQNEADEKSPCDDCTHYFNVDVGDFLWDGSDQICGGFEIPVPDSQSYPPSVKFAGTAQLYTASVIRGDPPPDQLLSYGVPLYLRYSVFRL